MDPGFVSNIVLKRQRTVLDNNYSFGFLVLFVASYILVGIGGHLEVVFADVGVTITAILNAFRALDVKGLQERKLAIKVELLTGSEFDGFFNVQRTKLHLI
ncbi:hypothetical protein [Desulfitobacterium dehalogenans]|uniref:hypothetical protein n=1 Tax=Desulfitobacterium dehalogenans TaxID=36854 RepID=UPI0002498045|nr:hypothetical protein [Desulfitobacterium dehalogenans]